MRLTLHTDPPQHAALQATREVVKLHANRLLICARQHPQTAAADLSATLPAHATLPESTVRAVIVEVERARHWSRGGLKMDSFWLDARSMKVDVGTAQVSVWTVQGRLQLASRCGNYQRHLLASAAPLGGRVTLSRAGEWYVQLQLQATNDPAPSSVNELERQGLYPEVIRRLGRGRPAAKGRAQLALALLETGQIDRAELLLLTALGEPEPDPRIFLGLSILMGHRRDPQARLSHAQRGLNSGPDPFTRWWLMCSQARALVELGRAAEAAVLMDTVLAQIPTGELRARARALYFAQGVHAALDNFAAQDRYAREALRLYDLLGIHDEGLSLRLDLAYRMYFQGRSAESFTLIDEVLAMTERLQDPRASVAHLICAELHLLGEQFEYALRHLEQAHRAQQQHASDRLDVPIRAFTAECTWRLGRLDRDTFERTVESLHPSQDFDQVTHAFYTGLLAFEARKYGAARTAFEQVTAGVALLDGFRLRSYAFLAWLRWADGEPVQAASADLLRALSHVGGELALAVDARQLTEFYTACETLGIGGRPLQRLARRACPVLDVRTLGTFQAMVHQQALHIRLAKSRELLVYLILNGPSSRSVLMTALWDGSGRTQLNSYFKQAVHALREALRPYLPSGTDPVPHLGGLYRLSEQVTLRCDAAQLRDAQPMQGVHPPQLLQEYGGEFLPSVDTEWVCVLRELLENKALSIAMTLGHQLDAHDPLRAAEVYLHATRINPLFESAWQAAAAAYQQAGQPLLAEHTRSQFQRLLR